MNKKPNKIILGIGTRNSLECESKLPNFESESPNFGAKSPKYETKSPNFGTNFPYFGTKLPCFEAKSPQFRSKKTVVFALGIVASCRAARKARRCNQRNAQVLSFCINKK